MEIASLAMAPDRFASLAMAPDRFARNDQV